MLIISDAENYTRSRYEVLKKKKTSLEANVWTPLCCRLRSALLQLVAKLLGIRILQRLDRYRRLGPSLPLNATLIHHRCLHGDWVGAEDGEVQQELGAEVVIVRFHTLFDLVCFGIQRDLKKEKKGGICNYFRRQMTDLLLWFLLKEHTLYSGPVLLWRTDVTLRQTDWIFLKRPGVEPCCTTPSTLSVSCWLLCTGMGSLGVRGDGESASCKNTKTSQVTQRFI